MIRTETQTIELPIFGAPGSPTSQPEFEKTLVEAMDNLSTATSGVPTSSKMIVTIERTYLVEEANT